ncbi:proline-rich proteoglycan 2 [Alloactinosynnema sp. L-07]|uniref:hypothetical protein n=1 Tax=Alloactinosynnema sp. L-07 TaxID=1653480 RepID=UPI00065EFBE7|nr:hypothetical protein [Alloactinosynnema sp. L-07]CRK56206.1 proline-rich proteoglycan 2 [Alloactinosynnema sp. L-07]
MTYPGSGGQWPPNDPYQQGGQHPQQPGGYQQGGYQQPGYPQQGGYPQTQGYPQTGPQPTQGYPQTGPQPTQAYGGYGQQQAYGQQPYGYPVPPEQPKKRKGLVIGIVAAVVAVAAGGGVTWWALNRGSTPSGAESPTAAATSLVNAIGQGDVAGLLTGLAPAERDLMTTLNSETTKELQRLDVYKKDVDPNKIQGFELKTEGLKFDEAGAEKVNDHLTITKLIEGKVTISSDASKLPFTEEFIELAFPRGMNAKPETETIDIADVVKDNDGEPIRIATVNVDGEWYPSLFYTIADYGLQDSKKKWPKTSIPAKGADSPEAAVRGLADAALDADIARVIELLPPDEMAVIHDLGPMIVDMAKGEAEPSGVKITKLETETVDVEGATKVLLKEFEAEKDGEKVRVTKDGECYAAEVDGEKEQFCADDAATQIGGKRMDPDAKKALTNLVKGMIANTGVVTTKVDGKWYVSPIRSITDIQVTALKSLEPEDIKALFKLAE